MCPSHNSPNEMALQVALTPVGRDLDPTVRQWLRQGFAAYLRGVDGLEPALGLKRLRMSRNAHLRVAAHFIRGGPYAKARALKRLTAAPERLQRLSGPVGVALRSASAAGRLPTSERQLVRILMAA